MKYKQMAINLKALCLYHTGKTNILDIADYLKIDIVMSSHYNEIITVENETVIINPKIEKGKYYYLEFAQAISKIYLERKNKRFSEDGLEEFALELIIGEKELKSFYVLYEKYPNLSLFSNYFHLPEDLILKEIQKLNLKWLK